MSDAKQPVKEAAGTKPPTVSKRATPRRIGRTARSIRPASTEIGAPGTIHARRRSRNREPWNGSNSPHARSKRPDLALDRLGVAADDAEFEVLSEPKPGLTGRLRGEARVRCRPAQVTEGGSTERRPRKSEGRASRALTPRRRAHRPDPTKTRQPAPAAVGSAAVDEQIRSRHQNRRQSRVGSRTK
jgi:hypothetical protein